MPELPILTLSALRLGDTFLRQGEAENALVAYRFVLPAARKMEKDLRESGIRVRLDDREEYTPGWKFSDWEMRGVPLRIEIGPRDVKNNQVVAARRDTLSKENVSLSILGSKVPELLQEIQKSLFDQALDFQKKNTHSTQSYDEFKSILDTSRGFIKSYWCGAQACEEKIKEETKATIRIIAENKRSEGGSCIFCGEKTETLVYFARSY